MSSLRSFSLSFFLVDLLPTLQSVAFSCSPCFFLRLQPSHTPFRCRREILPRLIKKKANVFSFFQLIMSISVGVILILTLEPPQLWVGMTSRIRNFVSRYAICKLIPNGCMQIDTCAQLKAAYLSPRQELNQSKD